jgi:CRISPR-associated protein Cmr2
MQREFISTLNWVKDALHGKDKANNWERWKKEITVSSTISKLAPFLPRLPVVTHLPYLSFTLRIPFQLCKPYFSKDNCDFHLLDNPLRKDKVFQVPMVASTGWKGALRAAMVQELVTQQRGSSCEFAQHRFRLARLFGDEKGEEPDNIKGLARYLDEVGGEEAAEKFRQMVRNHFSLEAGDPMPHFQGSLYFFPTFFDNIGLEVINPHNRKTGVSCRGPILMECVPPGSKGEFTLLYVPFSPTKQSEKERRRQVAEDLKAVAQGIRSMLTVYGFGAKTSSGFGTVEERLDKKGVLTIHTYPSSDAKTEREFEDLHGLCNEAKDMADELNQGGAL